MELLVINRQDDVAIVELTRSVTNPLNPELVNLLTETLEELRGDPTVRALVLTSSSTKFFSIGLDIPELFVLTKRDFTRFFHSFNGLCIDLYTFPKPTVAAIPGHAIAGGCIVALCCDYRFIAEGKKLMGLNEIKLGVPVPYPGDCILRQIVGAQNARNIMESGDFYGPETLLEMGVVDEVHPEEKLLSLSIEKASSLGKHPHPAFGMIKRNRTEGVEAKILGNQEEKERFFVECWYSEEVRCRLKEAMKKF